MVDIYRIGGVQPKFFNLTDDYLPLRNRVARYKEIGRHESGLTRIQTTVCRLENRTCGDFFRLNFLNNYPHGSDVGYLYSDGRGVRIVHKRRNTVLVSTFDASYKREVHHTGVQWV